MFGIYSSCFLVNEGGITQAKYDGHKLLSCAFIVFSSSLFLGELM